MVLGRLHLPGQARQRVVMINCYVSFVRLRRRFEFSLFFALLLIAGAIAAEAGEYRAFWVDAFGAGFLTPGQVESLLGKPGTGIQGRIREANCNMVIIQVRRRFDVCYPSGVGEPYMSGLSPANFNALEAIIKAAHDTTGGKKRIEVHAWSVVYKTGKGQVYRQHIGTPTGSTTNFDNYWPTRLITTTGEENGDGAFDPGHPKVLEYLVNAHMDLVNFQTTAGPDGTDGHIDGIHYDYIRFEASTEGFNPTSVARYKERYGLTSDPLSTHEQFRQWRREQVTSFVRQMYARIQKTKPWIKQSGAFVTWNPSPASSTRSAFLSTSPYSGVYSDWDSWMQEGIVDIAVPMTYYREHVHANDYRRWMNFEKDRKFNRHLIVGPGIYLNYLTNAILHLNLTRAASPAGNYAHGFSGYSYRVPCILPSGSSGTWPDFSPTLVAEVTPTWDGIPPMPWKTSPTHGHLMGVVTLAGSGAWADHAVVTLTGPVNRSQYVDSTGFYAFIDLPPGSYTVTASRAGYANAQAGATVAIGEVTGNMYERNLVLDPAAPPTIITHPASLTVVQGHNAASAVAAESPSPLAYQWRFNGENLPGATRANYTRLNAQPADAGGYSVVVSNAFGAVTSSVATLTVVISPVIAAAPQSQVVTQSVNVTFTVTASGTEPLAYQWHFNNQPLTGATDSELILNNVQPGQAGNYSVVVSNFAQAVTSAPAALTVYAGPIPPLVTTEPADQIVSAGQTTIFAVGVNGAEPFAYQWQFNGANLAGATTAQFVLNDTQPAQAGGYRVVITNAFGAATSRVAALVVQPACVPVGLLPGWSLAPGSRPYLTVASLPNERGMTYNPATHRLILVNRTGPTLHVLDAETGADRWTLDATGISAGTYPLLMVGAAEDGAVYAGNLTTDGTSTAYRLYRWANDQSDTVPTLAYAGDPGAGNAQRWGDTMDVRGAGADTQIILASRSGNVVAIFTTADGVTFTPKLVAVAEAPTGAFGLGVTFGAGNTFWGKATGQDLRQVGFNLQTGTGIVLHRHGSPEIPGTVAPIGVSPTLNLLAGIQVGTANNHLRLYDLTASNDAPELLATNAFATDNENTQTGTGAVNFSNTHVYALGANNGLLALEIQCAVLPVAPNLVTQPQDVVVNQGEDASFSVTAIGDEPLSYQWYFAGTAIPGGTTNTYTRLNALPDRAGAYSVVVTNLVGSVTSVVATLTVNVPPNILVHPADLAVKWSSNATFTVTATGTAPLAYQWQFQDTPLPGATDPSYTRAGVQDADAGQYTVIVTNVAGVAISDLATLTVIPPVPAQFQLLQPLPDGRVQLTWVGETNWPYYLQAATNVHFSNALLLGPISGTNGWFHFVDDDATNLPQRFYRAKP